SGAPPTARLSAGCTPRVNRRDGLADLGRHCYDRLKALILASPPWPRRLSGPRSLTGPGLGRRGYPEPVADPQRKVLLDCDPGIDDAFAIVFALGHPGLDLCGITTVAGNVGVDQATANALSVCELVGRSDVPVVAGSPVPLLRPSFRESRLVHGQSGLGGARLPAPRGGPRGGHAVDFLIERISSAPGEITLVATGPLTNIALAVRRHPPLVRQVADFVIMGGSAGRGNVTPAAEFNIACDPEAAAIVFGAGWRVTMAGLDVTLQARATSEVRERMRGLGRLGAELLLPGLGGYGSVAAASGGQPVHDLCAVALVAAPGLFRCQPARVEVETAGRWTSGMTVTEFRAFDGERALAGDHNALVAMSLDETGFWELVMDAYQQVAQAVPAR
ncbi:MAG TPA: nucleoside hydrolase, partial [Streptosporangiaceae bacterium]